MNTLCACASDYRGSEVTIFLGKLIVRNAIHTMSSMEIMEYGSLSIANVNLHEQKCSRPTFTKETL